MTAEACPKAINNSDLQLSDSDNPAKSTAHVGFLLIPGFSMLGYVSVIEPLRAANYLSGRPLYRWSHVSIDGKPAEASNGVRIQTDFCVGTDAQFDYVFVCADGNLALFQHSPTFTWLRQLARRGVKLGGIRGGAWILARANMLTGYRFTIHWKHAPAFVEDYPDLDLRRSLYEIDRDRLTSSGGTATLDMMHAIFAHEHDNALAMAVSEWFLQTHIRGGADSQRMSLRERLGITNSALLRVISRMEQTLENPMSREELARLARVSIRHLERLFRQHLSCSLGEHYLALRLAHAHELVQKTSLSLLEVALACGFTSASHFSRSYRTRFGRTPRAERLREGPRGGVDGQKVSLR
ncbi:MAG: GlxA family transcriptional regulator [Proteobacteria bacterium]|nr:GlxA family transcriptional regulator [Pseudomonadota bacterium]